MIRVNKQEVFRKNLSILAIYNALFYDNRKKNKALVSITLEDEKLNSLFELRRSLIGEIRKTLRRVAYKGENIAYFTNIELGASNGELNKQFNPHIHFQFFYESFEPIKQALRIIEEQFEFNNLDTQKANEQDAYFGYIVKDYVLKNYNEELEANKKSLGMKKPLYTSSRKAISNYVIRYIYSYYKKHDYKNWSKLVPSERYKFILENIRDGKIQIKPLSEKAPARFQIVKNYQIYIKI